MPRTPPHSSLTRPDTRRHPWSTYAVFQTTITAGAIYDLLLFLTLGLALADKEWSQHWALIMIGFTTFWIFTKVSKVSGHYLRYPADLCYVPLQVAFGIFHTFYIKIPAFCTMNEVSSSHSWFCSHLNHWSTHPPFPIPRTASGFRQANHSVFIRRPGEAEKGRTPTTPTDCNGYHSVPTRLAVYSKSDLGVSLRNIVVCLHCLRICLSQRQRPHDTRISRVCFRSRTM